MGYSLDPISDNCYPGTTVLVNKYAIRDEAKLDEVETVLVSTRNVQWLRQPPANTFDFAHYCAIHHFLFSDLYDWAEQGRTVNISKKGTSFCSCENIQRQASLVFKRLAGCNFFHDLPRAAFVDEIVDFYCVTNLLHPFRDGNGRVGRTLMNYYLMTHGHPPVIIYDEDKALYYECLEKYDTEETLEPLYRFLQYETERTWQTQLALSKGQKRERPNLEQCR